MCKKHLQASCGYDAPALEVFKVNIGELATRTTGFNIITITETWGNNKPEVMHMVDCVTLKQDEMDRR